MLEKVKYNVMTSAKSEIAFDELKQGIGCFIASELFACVDWMEEQGYIKCISKEGFRQHWRYHIFSNACY